MRFVFCFCAFSLDETVGELPVSLLCMRSFALYRWARTRRRRTRRRLSRSFWAFVNATHTRRDFFYRLSNKCRAYVRRSLTHARGAQSVALRPLHHRAGQRRADEPRRDSVERERKRCQGRPLGGARRVCSKEHASSELAF